MTDFDAILVVSFGGPESRDEVIPFLENVLRGKPVPRERMLEVAEHYYHFGGVSPINGQNRALIEALRNELSTHGPQLPIYWGNRNWHPLLPDTLRSMKKDGIRRALAFFTSAYSSYSGCRQYREDIQRAQAVVGDGAPQIQKLRAYFNHPGFLEPMADHLSTALARVHADRRTQTQVVFTAHSIPLSMAAGCKYEDQLLEASRLVMSIVGHDRWKLVYQSRSGSPTQPWLEPDVCDYLREIKDEHDCQDVIIVPIGFVSDHMEVLFDLDTEARDLCDELGMTLIRTPTVGTHPKFVSMIRELIVERLDPGAEPRALGTLGPSHDMCPLDCCPSGRPAARHPSPA